ncbi:Uncharacterised protein [Arcanobacterium haemolyticum]|nr:Uncharacterised protein [Arcanobacterium haemolyticum]
MPGVLSKKEVATGFPVATYRQSVRRDLLLRLAAGVNADSNHCG